MTRMRFVRTACGAAAAALALVFATPSVPAAQAAGDPVALAAAPTLGGLTPSAVASAPGRARRFTAVYRDPDGYRDLTQVFLKVQSEARGIYLKYDRRLNKLSLYNDAGTAPVGSCAPGAAVTLANAQGTLSCAATTVAAVGEELTVGWVVAPKSAFASAGAKNLYLSATDRSNSGTGWVDAGDWWITAPLRIASLGKTAAAPGALLTIAGSGFVPAAAASVRFSAAGGYAVTVPATVASTTAVTAVVPPFVDVATGGIAPGTVGVQVLQASRAATAKSNAVAGFRVKGLPALTLAPGEVTASVAAFLETLLADAQARLADLDARSAEGVDSDALRAQLEALRLHFGTLKTKIRAAVDNPTAPAETVGALNGVTVALDQESLAVADRWTIAVLDGVLAEIRSAAAAPGAAPVGRPAPQVSPECEVNPQMCNSLGEPLITVKNYWRGETTAVTQYHYATALPGAREVLSDISAKFAAASATIGAAVVTFGGSIPVNVVALLTTANVVGSSAMFGMDATMLSIDSRDEAAARRVLEDFNGQLETALTGAVSPILGDISQASGVLFDLFTGWKPILETAVPAYLEQADAWIAGGPRTCTSYTYTDWSACRADDTQRRKVLTATPPGCTGTPVLSRACVPPCCGCYFDVYCTVFGLGGCWYCQNGEYVNGICEVDPQYTLRTPGECSCDPGLYEVCP